MVTLTKGGKLLDLSTASKVEMAIKQEDVVDVILCTKDSDSKSGIVYAAIPESYFGTVGTFNFDVRVTWLNTTRTTFLVSKFNILESVNVT
jgi:hypothetical protein